MIDDIERCLAIINGMLLAYVTGMEILEKRKIAKRKHDDSSI